MPRCASGEFCTAPQLPSEGTALYLHRCHICREVVHNCCALIDQETDPYAVLHICSRCSEAWRAARQQPIRGSGGGRSSVNTKTTRSASKRRLDEDDDDEEDEDEEDEDGKPYAAAGDDELLEYIDPHPSILPPSRLVSPFKEGSTKKSRYWRYYHIFVKDDSINIEQGLTERACCNICGKCVKFDRGSTSNLRTHLRGKHRPYYEGLVDNADEDEEDNEEHGLDNREEIFEKYKDRHPSIQPPERLIEPFGKGSPRKSVFWRFFHFFDKDNSDNIRCGLDGRACCNICGKDVKLNRSSTSPLAQHLLNNHKDCYRALNYKKTPKKQSESTTKAKKYVATRDSSEYKNRVLEHTYRSIALWAIQGKGRSFEVIEDPFFRNILRQVHAASKQITDADLAAHKSTTYMTAYNVRQQMRGVAYRLRRFLLGKIEGKFRMVASTYHHHTVNERNQYAALAVHFVDENFKLVKAVLSVVLSNNEFTAQKELTRRWREWNLSSSRLPFAVIDTDIHSNKFRAQLNQLTETNCFASIDYDLEQLASVAFQSKYFGDNSNGVNTEVLRKARELSNLLTGSQEIAKALHDVQILSRFGIGAKEALPAIRDDAGHWWTIYNMASRLVQLQPAIQVLVSNGTLHLEQNLSSKEWMNLDDLLLVLRPLASSIKALKDAKYASFVPHMLPKLHNDIQTNTATGAGTLVNQEVVECSRNMLHLYDQMYGKIDKPENFPKEYWIAMMLDPRFKSLKGVKVKTDFKEKLWSILEEEMRKNEAEHRLATNTGEKRKESKDTPSKPDVKRVRRDPQEDADAYFRRHFVDLEDDSDEDDDDDENPEPQPEQEKNVASIVEESIETHDIKSDCSREISMYKSEKGLKVIDKETGEYNDPWTWWKDRYEACPILWRMAQSYLCIPVLTNEVILADTVEGIRDEMALPPTEIPELCVDPANPGKNADLIEDILLVKLNQVGIKQGGEGNFFNPMDNLPMNADVVPPSANKK